MNRRTFVKASMLASGTIAFSPIMSLAYNPEDLPKVVLLGDSIRIGYKPFVEKELEGIANVWAPDENCQTTDNIIYNLHGWIKKQAPDLVHLNAGLHDIRTLTYDSRPGETIVKPAHYRDNLETIFSWIQKNVACKIIWASTTPVIDEKVKARNGSYTRYDVDIRKINKIALKVAKKFDVPVNDLYTFVKEEIGEDGMKKDGIHYEETAYEQLGTQVASKIIEVLNS